MNSTGKYTMILSGKIVVTILNFIQKPEDGYDS
jgi:hypothetical protein